MKKVKLLEKISERRVRVEAQKMEKEIVKEAR